MSLSFDYIWFVFLENSCKYESKQKVRSKLWRAIYCSSRGFLWTFTALWKLAQFKFNSFHNAFSFLKFVFSSSTSTLLVKCIPPLTTIHCDQIRLLDCLTLIFLHAFTRFIFTNICKLDAFLWIEDVIECDDFMHE